MKPELIDQHYLNELDRFLKLGQASQVKSKLKQIKRKDIPRSLLVPLAKIGMRVGLPQFSLSILTPIVRPLRPIKNNPTPLELAQYAIGLVQIGAIDEGLKILESLNGSNVAEVYFYQAIALFNIWDYQRAIPILTRYLESTEINNYEKLVGNVNLAAAFIAEKNIPKAQQLLSQLLPQLREKNYQLLLGNVLELSSQLSIAKQDYPEALSFLTEASSVIPKSNLRYHLFLKKWDVITNMFLEGANKKQIAELEKVKDQARQLRHWETIRECDLYKAIIQQDQTLFKHVYIGSPLLGFRKRMKMLFPYEIEIPQTYDWCIKARDSSYYISQIRCFDMENGKDLLTGATLKSGQLIHRLLFFLSQDFYRPIKLATLYAHLFPDRYYNYIHSPARIYELIFRTRKWLNDHQVPILIEENMGEYNINATEPLKIRISTQQKSASQLSSFIKTLLSVDLKNGFTCTHIVSIINKPRRTVHRLIQNALEDGFLQRIGKGSKTKYHLTERALLLETYPKAC